MAFTSDDFTELMQEKLYSQYQDSTNFQAYMQIFVDQFQELEDVLTDILNLRELDNAEGTQLEYNGELVNQNWPVYDTNTVLFFGLDPTNQEPVEHLGLADDTDDSVVGGILRDEDQAVYGYNYVSEAIYRRFIYLKATKNNFSGGYEALIEAIQVLFDITETGMVEISEDFTDSNDPFVLLDFKYYLTSEEKAYLTDMDSLPRPAGIRYTYNDLSGAIT